MLKTKDLIEGIEEKYVPMLKQVNIPDFTKCIATYMNESMDFVPDKMIKEYLLTWAKNKYKYFHMFGNKTQLDRPLIYKRLKEETRERMIDLAKKFPAYYPWLDRCHSITENKMSSREIGWELEKWLESAFPSFRWNGGSLTRFFKHCLQAPDELINQLAQVFENNTVEATYTLSIDPVDMMLASENPYDWQSCYRLDPCDEEIHMDGCLAAVLDTSTIITYVWNREGELSIYEKSLQLKKVRYKKMRAWVSIAPTYNAFYMAKIYPGKGDYGSEFEKALRVIIEKVLSDFTGLEDNWTRVYESKCERYFPYGYDEMSHKDCTFVRKGFEDVEDDWTAYNVRIKCPCGCKEEMPGFHDDYAVIKDRKEYNGEGMCHWGVKEQYYCEYSGDYCDCDCEYDDCCCDCCYWQDAHPTCELDRDEECPFYSTDSDEIEIRRDNNGSYIEACGDFDHCSRCRIWQEEHPAEEEEDEGAED